MGAWLALGCALTWALAVITFRCAKDALDPLTVNAFKSGLALVLMVPTLWLVEGRLWLETDGTDLAVMAVSGGLGIGIADLLFIATIRRIGASRTAIVECLYSPMVILFALVFLHESLGIWQWLGVTLVMGGVLWTTLEADPNGTLHLSDSWVGVMLGVGAMVSMAGGIIMVKPMLERLPLFWIISVRLGAGFILSTVTLMLAPGRVGRCVRLWQHPSFWAVTLASFLGTYLSMIFWVAGNKYAEASVTAVINQSATVFTIVMAAVFLKERMSRKTVGAAALALSGVLLVILA